MNKRIIELREQAFSECKRYDDDCGDNLVKTNEVFDKFAELIIQDCIDILAGYRGKVTWLNEEEMHQHPIYVIQKHFGVKE